MKNIILSIAVLVIHFSICRGGSDSEPRYGIWSIEKDLPHDQAIRFESSRLLSKDGEVVGVIVNDKVDISVEPSLPPVSEVEMAYYGLEHGSIIREFSEKELGLIYEIIVKFSYRTEGDLKVFRVQENGHLTEKDLDPTDDYLSLHLCTLGIYLKLKDEKVFVIDGHADSKYFNFKQEPYLGFKNEALNVFLTWVISESEDIQPVAGGDATR